MKHGLMLLVVLCGTAYGQGAWTRMRAMSNVNSQREQLDLLVAQQKTADHQRWLEITYRVVNGETNKISGPDWFAFNGKVREVTTNGIVVEGQSPAFPETLKYVNGFYQTRDIFIWGYTNRVAQGDELSGDVAKLCTKQVYREMIGSRELRSMPMPYYGTPWTAPIPTQEEIAAAKAKVDAQAKAAKALKFNQDQADKGDAYGQYRMGQRYLTGDGVAKDLPTARA